MQGEIRRRLTMLCSEATDEQDPQRFRQIVHEISLLLQEKQDRLDKVKSQRSVQPEFGKRTIEQGQETIGKEADSR
jgi:hypothetical protein